MTRPETGGPKTRRPSGSTLARLSVVNPFEERPKSAASGRGGVAISRSNSGFLQSQTPPLSNSARAKSVDLFAQAGNNLKDLSTHKSKVHRDYSFRGDASARSNRPSGIQGYGGGSHWESSATISA